MPLHPVAEQLLSDAAASDQPNCHLLPIEVARSNFERTFEALPVEAIASTEDLIAVTPTGRIPVRLYRPVATTDSPLVLYLHGGGWQMGSVDSHDGICRALANASGFTVLSVGYRQPPAHTFPTAPRDCFEALVWARDSAPALGIDAARVAVVGDSAGGNLAAAVALQVRDHDGPDIACQVLIYPATTFDLDVGFDSSMEGYVLFRDEIEWHKQAYFRAPEDAASDYASPLNADLTGLPPTFVLTAEYDPLGVAGRSFAEKLANSDVETEHGQYDGMIHGFIQFPGLFPEATRAVEDIAGYLQAHLAGGDA